MICETIPVKVEGAMEGACLQTYFLYNSEEIKREKPRAAILMCPGGGYGGTSDREAEPIALKFLAEGFHVAVLRYSVSPVRYPVALLELAGAVKYLREHAGEYQIDPERIIIQGCSAGGHLAASYGVFWRKPFLREYYQVPEEMLRPDGLILNYPVITSGEFAHQGSFENLLGERLGELKDEMSLEYQVNTDVPPVFIWHTYTDDCVPVENSLLFVNALRKHQIPTEFHMYAKGGHGLGLANELTMDNNGLGIQKECEGWVDLAVVWMKNGEGK